MTLEKGISTETLYTANPAPFLTTGLNTVSVEYLLGLNSPHHTLGIFKVETVCEGHAI